MIDCMSNYFLVNTAHVYDHKSTMAVTKARL